MPPPTYVQIQSARPTPGPEFDALMKASNEAYAKEDWKTSLERVVQTLTRSGLHR